MAGMSWLVDGNRFATKIKNASGTLESERVKWKSNPSRACPNCQHIIDNSDVTQEWPGLPRGVKFDPSDQEIIWHLLAKVGVADLKPHPFINEFIPTVEEDDGICYTHPQNLPGVKQDGSAAHFFHQAIKAYNTGTRKRRKIYDDDLGDVRWHKTGKTKPVILDGIHRGCKKIMVLYSSIVRGGKPEKTNWVMHQYHLGTGEEEKDGEYVISKVFYQQQQVKQSDKVLEDFPESSGSLIAKVDPVTPKSATPEHPLTERRNSNFYPGQESPIACMELSVQQPDMGHLEDEVQTECEQIGCQNILEAEDCVDEVLDRNDNHAEEEAKWWDNESQYLLDSQQLVEGLSICDELLQSQSSNGEGHENGNDGQLTGKPRLSDYADLGAEDLKKDLEDCQNLVLDPANIELDTPPDFRLSQLEFGSQDSFIAWGGGKVVD